MGAFSQMAVSACFPVQAMDLPGISIRTKLSLGIQAGQLSRAQRYLQALAAGATDPAHLKGLGGRGGGSSIHSSPQGTPPGAGTPYDGRTPRSSHTSFPPPSPSNRSEDGGDDLLGVAGKDASTTGVPPSHALLSSLNNGIPGGGLDHQVGPPGSVAAPTGLVLAMTVHTD